MMSQYNYSGFPYTTGSKQSLFDFVVAHLRKQGKRSYSEDGSCRYRQDELMCAAGCLLSDREYSPEMENRTWITLIETSLVLENSNNQLIRDLQIAHDAVLPKDWEMRFELIAKESDLSYT